MPDSVLKVGASHVTDNADVRLYVGGTLGATDNRIPRSDGAGGFTLQASGVTISDADVMSGVTFGDPTTAQHPATKAYVDAVAVGLDVHPSVKCRATGNLTLSGEQTIDDVLTSASRVLVDQQTTASQDGIYLTGAGAWARVSDMPTGTRAAGAFVFVEEGTLYADYGFVCTTNGNADVVGTDGLVFAAFSRAGMPVATTSLDGLMSAADKTKLDGIATGAQVCSAANVQAACAALASSLDLNAQKIIDLANGTAATDAAAFGQLSCAVMQWGYATGAAVDADRWPLSSYGSLTTVATAGANLAVRAGTLSAIRSFTNVTLATNTLAATLQINGVDSALTCTIAAGGTAASLTGQAVAVAAGDRLIPRIRQNGTEASTNAHFRVAVV